MLNLGFDLLGFTAASHAQNHQEMIRAMQQAHTGMAQTSQERRHEMMAGQSLANVRPFRHSPYERELRKKLQAAMVFEMIYNGRTPIGFTWYNNDYWPVVERRTTIPKAGSSKSVRTQ